jgi:hypothetical protein
MKRTEDFLKLLLDARSTSGLGVRSLLMPYDCFIHICTIIYLFKIYCEWSVDSNTYKKCFGDDMNIANNGNIIVGNYIAVYRRYADQIRGDELSFKGVTDITIMYYLMKEFRQSFAIIPYVRQQTPVGALLHDSFLLCVTDKHIDLIMGDEENQHSNLHMRTFLSRSERITDVEHIIIFHKRH